MVNVLTETSVDVVASGLNSEEKDIIKEATDFIMTFDTNGDGTLSLEEQNALYASPDFAWLKDYLQNKVQEITKTEIKEYNKTEKINPWDVFTSDELLGISLSFDEAMQEAGNVSIIWNTDPNPQWLTSLSDYYTGRDGIINRYDSLLEDKPWLKTLVDSWTRNDLKIPDFSTFVDWNSALRVIRAFQTFIQLVENETIKEDNISNVKLDINSGINKTPGVSINAKNEKKESLKITRFPKEEILARANIQLQSENTTQSGFLYQEVYQKINNLNNQELATVNVKDMLKNTVLPNGVIYSPWQKEVAWVAFPKAYLTDGQIVERSVKKESNIPADADGILVIIDSLKSIDSWEQFDKVQEAESKLLDLYSYISNTENMLNRFIQKDKLWKTFDSEKVETEVTLPSWEVKKLNNQVVVDKRK